MDVSYDLHYAKPDFAIKKAESFVKGMHRNFVDFLGRQVIFEFENMGEIK